MRVRLSTLRRIIREEVTRLREYETVSPPSRVDDPHEPEEDPEEEEQRAGTRGARGRCRCRRVGVVRCGHHRPPAAAAAAAS